MIQNEVLLLLEQGDLFFFFSFFVVGVFLLECFFSH